MAANLTLKYNSATVHIDGLDIRTPAYEFTYALSACPSLSRSFRMCTARGEYATALEALKAAHALARSLGKKVCKHCQKAADAMAAADYQKEQAAAAEAAAAPVVVKEMTIVKVGRREALGAASAAGWALLYDKPRQECEVARRYDETGKARYALICKRSGKVHELARLSDERAVRKADAWR